MSISTQEIDLIRNKVASSGVPIDFDQNKINEAIQGAYDSLLSSLPIECLGDFSSEQAQSIIDIVNAIKFPPPKEEPEEEKYKEVLEEVLIAQAAPYISKIKEISPDIKDADAIAIYRQWLGRTF